MGVKVSVVVPTYRRPLLLKKCLQALLRQDSFYPYEIVVADDAADSSIEEEIHKMSGEKPGIPVRYVPVRRRHGPAAARNQGWRAAEGEIIAFTDDDCIPSPGWLRHGLEAFGPG